MITLAAFEGLFLNELQRHPVYFVSWVFTVVVSIVLHELGHGVAAIHQGDDTPRVSGHMNFNPLVHMGATSLIFLFLVGIAWGQMPVDPTRFRSKYGDAIVSAAGPAVNLLLAFLGLTVLGLLLRFGWLPETDLGANIETFLGVFGVANIALFLLNLLPIPPLDGSTVLGSLFPPFRRFAANPHNQGVFLAVFFGIFFFGGYYLFDFAGRAAVYWRDLIAG